MVKCRGCGFNVEQAHVLEWGSESECPRASLRCSAHCTQDVREAYRRGFNEGLDAMARTVEDSAGRAAGYSGLRRRMDD
jgi:hypothetical protein